ncbi:hypothetical protein AciX8_0679 [Granulicella mallensis MP5ACTX8]|uniref:Glycosyltransferase RgtA/B/C/D-like domain-containing protein n=2 Tax=Granulicella mallensis TaxID=940614 RepID=G8NR44_GRAMM|nr:hypothetical protein AciX8_0679 [Granulicella mallensis MP5ACTX8]
MQKTGLAGSGPTAFQEPQSEPRAVAQNRSRLIIAISVLLTFLICYLRGFVLPNVPTMSWSDQMLFATNGTRILAGQMPYRDYFQFLTPGTDLIYSLLFRWFGVELWIPNLTMACLAAIAMWLMMLAARRVLRGMALALPALFLIGFGLAGSLDATHHWFSTIIAMTAMLVLMRDIQPRHIAFAGALCGVAASFTQTKGALITIGFLIYLLWKSIDGKEPARVFWYRSSLLLAVALSIFFAINLHFILLVGWTKWVQAVIVFPLRYYSSIPGQTGFNLLAQMRGQKILGRISVCFICGVVISVYPIFLLVLVRKRRTERREPWDQLFLLAITGFSMFLTVAPGMTALRVSTVSLPAMVLLAWLLSRVRGPILLAGQAIAVFSFAAAIYMSIQTQRATWNYLTLPAGRSAIPDRGRYELYRWTAEHTHPGDICFGVSYIYLPLWLHSPAPIDSPGPWGYYRPEQIAASIAAVEENKVPVLILNSYSDDQSVWSYKADSLRPLQIYLDAHYRHVKTFTNVLRNEAWIRKGETDAPITPGNQSTRK